MQEAPLGRQHLPLHIPEQQSAPLAHGAAGERQQVPPGLQFCVQHSVPVAQVAPVGRQQTPLHGTPSQQSVSLTQVCCSRAQQTPLLQ